MIGIILFLIIGDMVCSLSGLSIALLISPGQAISVIDVKGGEGLRMLVFALVGLFSGLFVGIFRTNVEMEWKEICTRGCLSQCVCFVLLSSLYYLFPSLMYGGVTMLTALIAYGLFQVLWNVFIRVSANLPVIAKRVLILGTGPLAGQIGSLIAHRNRDYVLAGYMNCASEAANVPSQAIVGNEENICDTVRRSKADKVVVSLSERRGVFPLKEMLACKLRGVKVMDAPTFYEKATGKLLLENITPSWFIFSHGFRITLLLRTAKRLIDVVASLVGLILFLPFFPLVAILIRTDSPGPVFFSQERVGEGEKPFIIHKFRTMRRDAEKGTGAVWAKENDPRVTRLGRLLRKCRIDEIPQLINVLVGDMSLVGPRPERPEFVQRLKEIIPYYSERHSVKPGLTGWAQVCYPYGASEEDALEKLRYDLYYTKNISLSLDIRTIFKTVKVVLFGQGGR
jgi:sugar transferase (PEP-CTERM system associated)